MFGKVIEELLILRNNSKTQEEYEIAKAVEEIKAKYKDVNETIDTSLAKFGYVEPVVEEEQPTEQPVEETLSNEYYGN